MAPGYRGSAMRAIIGLGLALAMVAACAPTTEDPDRAPSDVISSPEGSTPTLGTLSESDGADSDATPITGANVAAAISAIEQALLLLGLEPTVTYDQEASRFSIVAVGNVPFDNAKLAERIIRIVGDEDRPGAISLTHSQLLVRIQPDPNSDRQCSCSPQ